MPLAELGKEIDQEEAKGYIPVLSALNLWSQIEMTVGSRDRGLSSGQRTEILQNRGDRYN